MWKENRIAYDLSNEFDEGILVVFLPNWSFVLVGLLVMEERGVVSLEQSKARSFVKGGVPESVFTRGPIGPGEAGIASLSLKPLIKKFDLQVIVAKFCVHH